MDKDRIAGKAHEATGKVKEVAGRVTGDRQLEAEGTGEKIGGKAQNAVGNAKDAVRDASKH